MVNDQPIGAGRSTGMSLQDWERRIARAEELEARHTFASEILRFYATVARFQAKVYWAVEESGLVRETVADGNPFGRLDPGTVGGFREFVSVVEQNAPEKLKQAAFELRTCGGSSHFEILLRLWSGDQTQNSSGGPADFFARAFLQPYSIAAREHAKLTWNGPTAYLCPFCKRKPGVGVLRPLGEGGQRVLICSFCLGEWEFRRILCPGCGEGDPAKLPVYTAEELKHVRVEACDSCKSYIKTVDFTKSALGEPIVDEIASVPLDLWAQGQGYRKVQVNLMQM
jgi:FdhE protein